MASKKEKSAFLLLAIFLLVIVAASAFFWQKKLPVKEWVSFQKIKNYFLDIFDRDTDVLTLVENDSLIRQSPAGKNRQASQRTDTLDAHLDSLLLLDYDSLSYILAYQASEYYIESGEDMDSLEILFHWKKKQREVAHIQQQDTQTVIPAQLNEPNQLSIKRDQFVLSKVYTIAGFPDSLVKSSGHLDSLLTNNVRSYRLPGNALRIEFWKSPINYTGYKMSKTRLTLFGNFDPDELALEYSGKKVYLVYQKKYFPVEIGDSFRPLVEAKKPR